MNAYLRTFVVVAALASLLAVSPSLAEDQLRELDQFDVFGKTPTLRAADVDQVRQQVDAWLDKGNVNNLLRVEALAQWPEDAAAYDQQDMIDRLAATFAAVDPRAQGLLEYCTQIKPNAALPDAAWLADESLDPLVGNHLRLYYGRWLARQNLYDESLAQLEGLEAEQVVDPATLLFFRSVGHHRLLNKDPGIKSLRSLLDDVVDSPQRYVAVAELMYEDLKGLKDDSLDHISRRMDDVRRRLDLGRANKKVRKIEDDVIASLDKLIEEMEKQRQQQQQQQGGGNMQPSNPAQDSQIMGGRGPGDVDRRNLGASGGWGDLPPKQRQEALQQIGKDFPSHYREVIEQYFRKVAGERAPE